MGKKSHVEYRVQASQGAYIPFSGPSTGPPGPGPSPTNPPGTPAEAQEATTVSSGFGIVPAQLPEDTPQVAGTLFSQTPVLQSPEPTAMVVETYRPPPPQVETPQAVEGWSETQENLLGVHSLLETS